MFETDNWEDCIREAVWFGQKIPQKRRHFRGGINSMTKDPIIAFFEDNVNLAECKESLMLISNEYTESSKV